MNQKKEKIKICSVAECNNKISARGWCNKHYLRWKNNDDPLQVKYIEKCTIEGCEKDHFCHGLCAMHDARRRRNKPLLDIRNKKYESFLECYEDNIKKNLEAGCWEWQSTTRKGYGWMCVKNERIACHRFAYTNFIGEIPDGMWVLHKCDNPLCSAPSHLFLGTHSENMQDCINKKRHQWREGNLLEDRLLRAHEQVKGANNPMSKLTESDVIAIKQKISNNEKTTKIAREFNVTDGAISMIRHNKTWKHVQIGDKK